MANQKLHHGDMAIRRSEMKSCTASEATKYR